jgi:hypothetical protein
VGSAGSDERQRDDHIGVVEVSPQHTEPPSHHHAPPITLIAVYWGWRIITLFVSNCNQLLSTPVRLFNLILIRLALTAAASSLTKMHKLLGGLARVTNECAILGWLGSQPIVVRIIYPSASGAQAPADRRHGANLKCAATHDHLSFLVSSLFCTLSHRTTGQINGNFFD